MTHWKDWKDDEKPETAFSSVAGSNLKQKEIFGLVCQDFRDYEWNLWTIDRGFWNIGFFRINYDTPIDPAFEAVHTEVYGPGKLQEYGALNMKKKNWSRGASKRDDVKKWMKN